MPSELAKLRPTMLEWYIQRIADAKHTKAIGWLGERIVMELIPRDRFIVYQPKHRKDGDLHITDRRTGVLARVEIKFARRNSRGKFEFRLRKHDKHGDTDISHADFVIFVCFWQSLFTFYFVPVKQLPGNSKTIPFDDRNSEMRSYRLPSLSRLELPMGVHHA